MKLRNCKNKCHLFYKRKNYAKRFVNDTKKCKTCNFATETKDTQCKCCNILFRTRNLYHYHNKIGIIRKSSTAKPNMLETFKPTIHSLVPELQQLTDEKLYNILEEDDD
jgi:hypothetical protein